MKKIYLILLSMALLFSLAACGGNESSSSEASTSSPEASSQSVAESSDQPVALEEISDSPEPAESENLSGSGESGASADAGGMLIAYFSWSGNTEQMAQTIQTETGGDLFRIEPAMTYTDDYDTLLDIAQQEQADNARPGVHLAGGGDAHTLHARRLPHKLRHAGQHRPRPAASVRRRFLYACQHAVLQHARLDVCPSDVDT